MGYDLLVIGAGLSGLSAALTAAQAGLKVGVIAKGLGATHWHAGTVDLLGYRPESDTPIQTPLSAIEQLAPDHPYRQLGPERLTRALQLICRWLAADPLGYAGATAGAENLWLPSAVGAARPTWLAPAAQRAGDLSRPEPLLLVGFQGLRDFYPKLIAENLTRLGHQARAAALPLTLITPLRDRNPVQLAGAVDEPAVQERLAVALKALARPGERVGLPALLGLQQHATVWQNLQSALGQPVFEIPTLPPSVPGIRLFNHLRQQLTQLGVRLEIGLEITQVTVQGQLIQSVQTATSARPLTHRAQRFLLATGGVLGGGFSSDHTGRFWEVVFNLPLTTPPDRQAWFRHQFLHPQGHPLFQGGVQVNGALQPVDQTGNVVYHNLWAAGGVLAHADPIRERSLEGIALTTGIAAAEALRQA